MILKYYHFKIFYLNILRNMPFESFEIPIESICSEYDRVVYIVLQLLCFERTSRIISATSLASCKLIF